MLGFDPTGEIVPAVAVVYFVATGVWTGFEAYQCYKFLTSPDPCLSGYSFESCINFTVGAAGFFGAGAVALRAGTKILPKIKLPKVTWPWGRITNPVPERMARVVPNGVPLNTLGRPDAADVFVTSTSDIAGMNAKQIAKRLGIAESPNGYAVIEFKTPRSGVASPVFRNNPGFVGGGRTSGGAREFVIPNGPIPDNSIIRNVR